MKIARLCFAPTEITAIQPGSEFQAIEGHGASFWTRTAKIDTELKDGTSVSYFLKVRKRIGSSGIACHLPRRQISNAEGAEDMMRGEFESQNAIHHYVPALIPKPFIFGQYKSDSKTFFYLSEFVEMTGEIPQPRQFCALLASLHHQSMEDSPNKYGYQISTTQGNISLNNGWEESWSDFFAKAMTHMIEQKAKTQGPSKEIEELTPAMINKVIPRLLRPLETGDQPIRPCLVHGDLWHGNTSVSVETGDPYVFDSCVLWAHNECRQIMTSQSPQLLMHT